MCVYVFCVLLYFRRCFENKQPGSTISKTKNGSRSSYLTGNKLAFLSVLFFVETKPANLPGQWPTPITFFFNFFVSSKLYNPWWHIKNRYCSIFKVSFAQPARRRSFWTLVVSSAERFIGVFVLGKYPGRSFVQNVHLSNKLKNSFVEALFTIVCATHGNCSQVFHSYIQRNFGPELDGTFVDS